MKSRSHEDPIAIQQTCFDEKYGAMRMVLVAGESPVQYIQSEAPSQNTAPVVVKETEIKIVEVPTTIIQTEYKVIEVEKLVVQTEYRTIEVPVVTTEVKIVEVPVYIKGDTIEVLKEVPKYIVQTNTEYRDLPKLLVVFLTVSTAITLITSLLKFFK